MDWNSELRVRETEWDVRRGQINPQTRAGRTRSRLKWLHPFEIRITTPRRSIDRMNWELYHEFD
jgi:hypothetical protein